LGDVPLGAGTYDDTAAGVSYNAIGWTDNSVVNGTSYYYCVRAAHDEDGAAGALAPSEGPCHYPEPLAAPYQEPETLSINKAVVHRSQNECYTITITNVPGMTVDMKYRYNWGAEQLLSAWPLDSNGQNSPCTTAGVTPLGNYTFTAMQDTSNGQDPWRPTGDITIEVQS
jgi:hypothetical protein